MESESSPSPKPGPRASPVMTRSRRKSSEEQVKFNKRQKTLFQHSKVIGPRDIQVNLNSGKIKIEQDEMSVKMEAGQDLLGESLSWKEVVVKEEVEVPMDHGEEDFFGRPLNSLEVLQNEMELLKEANFAMAAQIEELRQENGKLREEAEKRIGALERIVLVLQQQIGLEPEVDTQPVSSSPPPPTMQNLQSSESPVNCNEVIRECPVSEVEVPSYSVSLATDEGQKESLRLPEECEHEELPDDKLVALFPQVLNVLWNNYQTFILSLGDFLNARLLCSSVKTDLDEMNFGPYKITQEKLTQNHCFWINVGEGIIWSSQNGVATEFQVNRNIIEAPSVLRIEDGNKVGEDKRKESLDIINAFLKTHGGSFRTLIYSTPKTYAQEFRFDFKYSAEIFLRWLWWMRNLETISLEGGLLTYSSSDNYLAPFPTLVKMTHFCNSLYLPQWPVEMLKAALVANRHISSLNLWNCDLDLGDFSLPQLKTLRLMLVTVNSPAEYNLKVYETLHELNAPLLENLAIAEFLNASIYSKLRLAFIQFGGSLQTLELNLSLDWHDCIEPLPEMTRLEKLVLRTTNCYMWSARIMDFVSRSISLKYLVVYLSGNSYWCDCGEKCSYRFGILDRKVGLRKHLKIEFVSKLWKGLPGLRQVEVEIIASSGVNPIKLVFIRDINDNPVLI